MTMIRKLVQAEITALGDDEVEVVISTAALARDGHVLVPQGCRLENYRANPIVLWSHDPDKPVGNSENIAISGDKITATVRFAQLGISQDADRVRGLVKTGVVRAVSVGFDPLDGEPLDPKRPRGGQRFTDWDLMEFSFCSVPVDVGAVVTARANIHGKDADMEVEEPAGAKPRPAIQRAVRAGKVQFTRGVYQIAQLCYMFEELGWQLDLAKYEAAIENDASQVPAMLAAILQDLGDALIAMTEEEVAEALAGRDIDADDEGDTVLVVEERAHIAAATSPVIRAFRRGVAHAKLRAGKTLSAETVRCLREARDMHEEAIALGRSAVRKHKDGLAAVDDVLNRSGASEADGEEDASADVDEGGARSADGGLALPAPEAILRTTGVLTEAQRAALERQAKVRARTIAS